MSHGPTAEQLAAIECAEPRLTVKASAGAGKTRVLVARYLRHVVQDGLRPDQILTITFTRKAAAEMKKRIVNDLRDLGRMEDAQIAETGPIQTIHGFCERALRENSLVAGVDPEFEILGQGQASLMRDRVLQETLTDDHTDAPHIRALIRSLAGKSEYNTPVSLQAKLTSVVQAVLGDLRGSAFSPDHLEAMYRSPESLWPVFARQMVDDLPGPVRQSFEADPSAISRSGIMAACKAAKVRAPAWVQKAAEGSDQESLAQTCGLVQLALCVWRRLEREMRSLQAFDFAYLESCAVRLLTEHGLVRDRLRRQYRVVLVDEAQDVNPVQFKLIDALQAEGEMMVGDAKQSIYGFRQADPRLFRERTELVRCCQLTRNFRSEDGILRFVDNLFRQLWAEEYEPMAPRDPDDPFGGPVEGGYEGVEAWPLKAKDTAQTAEWIGELLNGGVRKRDVAVLVRYAAYAAELSVRLTAIGIDHRIAGGSEKFFTRLVVRDLANALQALANPEDDFALLALLRSPVVDLSLDSVVVLATLKPVYATLATFEPPVESDGPKIEEFLSWFAPLSRYADRLAAWEVLGEVFDKSPYLVSLATRSGHYQNLANARKLFALAAQEPTIGPQAFAEQIRMIQLIRHTEGDAPAVDDDADVVTLMTIHKSKGLEFPVVVLSDTHYALDKKARDVTCDMATGLVSTKFSPTFSMSHRWLSDAKKARERQEELRVLYVAMTRAKQRLCVCIHNEAKETVPAGLIARHSGFRGEPLPGMVVRFAATLDRQ